MAVAFSARGLDAQSNPTIYIGNSSIQPSDDPKDKATIVSASPREHDIVIVPRPKAGAWWVAIFNNADKPLDVEVIATAVFSVQELPPTGSVSGQVSTEAGLLPLLANYLRSSQGTLGPTQYRVNLKAADLQGVTAMRITIKGATALNLHLRFDRVVELEAGQIRADLSAVGPGNEKSVLLSGGLLKPGSIYLAVEAPGVAAQNFDVQVELVRASGSVWIASSSVTVEPVKVAVPKD